MDTFLISNLFSVFISSMLHVYSKDMKRDMLLKV